MVGKILYIEIVIADYPALSLTSFATVVIYLSLYLRYPSLGSRKATHAPFFCQDLPTLLPYSSIQSTPTDA